MHLIAFVVVKKNKKKMATKYKKQNKTEKKTFHTNLHFIFNLNCTHVVINL